MTDLNTAERAELDRLRTLVADATVRADMAYNDLWSIARTQRQTGRDPYAYQTAAGYVKGVLLALEATPGQCREST